VSKKIAADLAARIWSGRLPRWHDMPANLDLALEWGASERTAGRAKELLAACGLITKSPGGYYYVA
jgi:DNA-binding GntR family transcriptional regulator